MLTNIYEATANNINEKQESFEQYRGKVLLVVNVASKCGFTKQYEGLEKLYEKYKDKGLVVMGFPCNQFGAQEPGDAEEIKQFCSLTYNVSFPMFAKIEVNGKETHPIYQYLKAKAPGLLGSEAIKWNFTKFLIDRSGNVLERYAPATKPEELEKDIKSALG